MLLVFLWYPAISLYSKRVKKTEREAWITKRNPDRYGRGFLYMRLKIILV